MNTTVAICAYATKRWPLLTEAVAYAEERRSIAVLVVGGQALSLLLTLVAVPVIYTLLDDVGAFIHSRRMVLLRAPVATQPAPLPEGRAAAISHRPLATAPE